jgi:hypothetical protein
MLTHDLRDVMLLLLLHGFSLDAHSIVYVIIQVMLGMQYLVACGEDVLQSYASFYDIPGLL